MVSETATTGFVRRLVDEHLPPLLPRRRRRVSAGEVTVLGTGGSIELEQLTERSKSLRELTDQITLKEPLLITLDELQAGVIDELRQLAVVLQHSIREGRRLAFCGAGLPSAVDDVLSDKIITFLRRADVHTLGPANQAAVANAFVDVISGAGRSITAADAERAAAATGGYPFMIQLVGYHSWRQNPGRKQVTAADVDAGAEAARRRVGRLVFEPAINELSAVDRTFLARMAVDDGPSTMGDIAARMGVDANYASQYRLRLIAAGLIKPVKRGVVAFALPTLRDWLRDHAIIDP